MRWGSQHDAASACIGAKAASTAFPAARRVQSAGGAGGCPRARLPQLLPATGTARAYGTRVGWAASGRKCILLSASHVLQQLCVLQGTPALPSCAGVQEALQIR